MVGAGRPRTSAGVLLWRRGARTGGLEVFLVHPGGPYFADRDDGSWGIPKGELDADEDPLVAALRELEEETGFSLPPDVGLDALVPVRLRSGKVVLAWTAEYDVNPDALVSNTCVIEWPPRSGRSLEIPEVDRGGWFPLAEARVKVGAGQLPLVDELAAALEAAA